VSQQPFGDIPLFRELQKLLASGEGPINVAMARQVGVAVATKGVPEAPIPPEVGRVFSDGVRASEQMLTGYTRLPLEEPMSSDTVTRSWWVTSTIDASRWLLDRLALRFTNELGKLGGEAGGESNPLEAAMAQVGPLLLGLQTGQLIGQLAAETLSRYYLPIPRSDEGRLFFVVPNVDRIASDYGFDADRFRRWLALHDAARHLVFSGVPWLERYWRNLLGDLVDAIEIDVSDLQRRMMELQSRGMEALQENAQETALPVVQTERHGLALRRVRALLAVVEGYATHAAGAVAGEVVGDTARIDEGMARHRASPSEGESLLAGLVGVSFDRALETSGATFCAAVVKLHGLPQLNRVWEAPDNLPTPDEIKDPFAWMERVLER
jgi:putative hydrolase